jgi:hypothetical protein
MTLELAAPRRLWHFALAGLLPPASFIAGIAAGLLIVNLGGNTDAIQPVGLIVLFGLMLAGNALWARAIARLAGLQHARHFIFITVITQVAITFASVLVLGKLEEHFVENGNTALPLHVLYTLLFVPTTFIGAFTVGVVCGVAMGKPALAWRMGLHGASVAATAFLVLNVLQDLLGRRVGGPNAAATATMITVTMVCWLAASMAFSLALGRLLLTEQTDEARA